MKNPLFCDAKHGSGSVGRASVSKTEGREFEPLLPCNLKRKKQMRIKSYISDVYNELVNKVSWPTWSELQSSATIVMIASVIIALCIFAMDFSFRHIMTGIYSLFY